MATRFSTDTPTVRELATELARFTTGLRTAPPAPAVDAAALGSAEVAEALAAYLTATSTHRADTCAMADDAWNMLLRLADGATAVDQGLGGSIPTAGSTSPPTSTSTPTPSPNPTPSQTPGSTPTPAAASAQPTAP